MTTTPGGLLLVLAVLVPFVGVLAGLVLGGRNAQRIALLTIVAGTGIALGIAVSYLNLGGAVVYLLGGWSPPLGIALRADGLSIVMLAGLYFLLFRTRIGLSIRAVANNPMGAMYVGLNTERTIVATFVIGSMMGAVAGLVVGLYQGSIFPSMGFTPGVKAFVAMVMGGLSSIGGAVVCALILGMAEALTTTFFAQGWGDMVAYLFLLVTLVFFPTGLFGGGRERA